jgi:hypothetical protein
MFNKISHYTGIIACIALIISCFLPWTHYNSINETFTGFNVKPFPTGTNYGRAGLVMTIMTGLILLLKLTGRTWASRVNLFLAAVLLAYAVRTYIIFTGSLFEGEVETFAGIYLVLIFSAIIMVTAVFPKER